MSENRKREDKKSEKNESKANFKERVAEMLELPKEVVLNLPKLTMISNNNLIIENYKGVMEYDSSRVRVNTGKGIIKILGNGLVIKEITSEDIMVDGQISSLEFLT